MRCLLDVKLVTTWVWIVNGAFFDFGILTGELLQEQDEYGY